MTALELNADNAALSDTKGHGVNHSPWGYHATTVGGRKNKRRSKYTRQKQNKTRKQRK